MRMRRNLPLCRACGCETEQHPACHVYVCCSPVCPWYITHFAVVASRRSLKRRWQDWRRWAERTRRRTTRIA